MSMCEVDDDKGDVDDINGDGDDDDDDNDDGNSDDDDIQHNCFLNCSLQIQTVTDLHNHGTQIICIKQTNQNLDKR